MVVPGRGHALGRPVSIEDRILNSLSHGAIVGERYKIVAPIARGGFGAVYVAEQLTTERRVALKVLARYAENVSVDKLLGEARVTSRIVSDHIVQVIDAGLDATTGDVFVVMELLRGMTLDERLMSAGALPTAEVAEYMRQVAVGLDKAHGHLDREGRPTPIVHRDLKPSNLFLTSRDDGQPLVKILDFGAAKVLSRSAKASGLVHGTPLFMASEQALGEPSTKTTDIWAFGLITFNLLTGSCYWLTARRDGTEAQLFAEILMLPIVRASQRARELGVGRELPPGFDHWFSQCVNRDPTQRFASAGVAAFELSRLLGIETARGNEPLLPSPPTTVPAALAAVTERGAGAQQLETVSALTHTPSLLHPSRTRATLVMLGLMVLGAASVLLWKRASVITPSPPSISASPPPAGSGGVPPAAHEAAPALTLSVAPAASPQVPAKTAPVPQATASSSAKSSGKRAPSPRPTVRAKPTEATRNPYEQR